MEPRRSAIGLLLLLAAAGCRPEATCLPSTDAATAAPDASEAGPNRQASSTRFTGKYVILLDRSWGMRGFVRSPTAAPNFFVPTLDELERDLRQVGGAGTDIAFWGVSRAARTDDPPELITNQWPKYKQLLTCPPNNDDRNEKQCQGEYHGSGRLQGTIRTLSVGANQAFRVAAGDVVIIVTDLQIDGDQPAESEPVGQALSSLVTGGRAVGIVGVLSSFKGMINDLPVRGGSRSRVFDGQQPFFLLIIGPREIVQSTTRALEGKLQQQRAEARSISFGLAQSNPLEQLDRLIRIDLPAYAAPRALLPLGTESGIQQVAVPHDKFDGDGSPAPLVTARADRPTTERGAISPVLRIESLPSHPQPRLWAFAPGPNKLSSCTNQWRPIENVVERQVAGAGEPPSVRLGLRRTGGSVALSAPGLFYVEDRLRVSASVAPALPRWVQEWDLPYGVIPADGSLPARQGAKNYLGAGNLAQLVRALGTADLGQSFNAREWRLRLLFQLDQRGGPGS